MAVNEFIEELKRREAEQAKLGGFNAPAPAAPGFQPQTPMAQPESVFNAPAGGVASPSAMTMQVPANGEIVNIDNIAPAGATLDSAMQTPTQTPVASPQQLDQMLADPATVNVDRVAPTGATLDSATQIAQTPTLSIDQENAMFSDPNVVNVGQAAPVAPIASVAAPVVAQAPQNALSPEERARIEGRLAQTNADIVASGGTVPSLGAVPETPNIFEKGFNYLFRNPTAEQAQNTLETQPTDPAQRARLQDISAGTAGPSDLARTGSYLFARPENAGDPNILGPQISPAVAGVPAAGIATPKSVANLSVNGTGVVAPEAITGVATVPEVAAPTPGFSEEAIRELSKDYPQAPTASSGGMITRDSTGESFIGGSQTPATPEEVAAFNADSTARRTALESKIAAENPQITQEQGSAANRAAYAAERIGTSGAPVRQTIQDRDRSEKARETQLRKEGQRSIDDQMREFKREPHSIKERAAKKAELQGELNKSIKEDKDYNRATTEANFKTETDAYNKNDGGKISISEQIALRGEAREIAATELEETQSYNNASAAARSLVRDVGNIKNVAGTAKAQADSPFTTGLGGMVMSLKPGSKASDLRANLDTLTADSAFSALSEMRASSKTGGALGAISERELVLLGAAKRSLSVDQSDEQLIKNINTYVEIRNRMMADAKLRFAQDYGVERANEAFGGGQGGASGGGQRYPNDRNSGASIEELLLPKSNK